MNKELLNMYFKTYPLGTIQDAVKWLYQATLGSAHLVSNKEDNYSYLVKEYNDLTFEEDHILFEEISDELVRVHLEAIPKEYLSYYHHFFMESVEMKEHDLASVLCNITAEDIPFSFEAWKQFIEQYIKDGCPVMRHSDEFRKHYHPHYRLMHKKYLPYIQLLDEISKLPNRSVIVLEGNSGSGKSTLASLLSNAFGYPIISMDEFFLRPVQRNEKRLSEIGGNIDYERFYEEIVKSINHKQDIQYQVFDCSCMELTEMIHIPFSSSIIIEGCYSMHPYFKEYYDYAIFLEVDKEEQRNRILKRNGNGMLERFIKEWIPKEDAYFDAFDIKNKSKNILR